MTEHTIADLDAAFERFAKLAGPRDIFPSVHCYDGKVKFSVEFKVFGGFTGKIRAEGATLSEAVFSALAQLDGLPNAIAAPLEDRQQLLMHLDPSDTRTHIINEGSDLVGLQDKSEKDREP